MVCAILLPEHQIYSAAFDCSLATGTRELQHTLSAGAYYLDHSRIVRDLLQDRSHRRNLRQAAAVRGFFHVLQFFVQGKLLIAKVVIQPMAELQGRRKGLEESSQVL